LAERPREEAPRSHPSPRDDLESKYVFFLKRTKKHKNTKTQKP
jgi:hypothetical protein